MDREGAPIEEAAVHAHLERCSSCQEFQMTLPALRTSNCARQAPAPTEELLAKLAATRGSFAVEIATKRLVRRLRALLSGMRVAWAVPVMVACIALPPVSLAALVFKSP